MTIESLHFQILFYKLIFTPIATSERDTTADTTPARGRGIGIGRVDTTPSRGRGIDIERADTTPARERCISIGRGVPKRTSLHKWFDNPTSYTTNAPPNPHASPVHSQSNAVPIKKSITIGMKVFIAENGLTTYNVRLPSNRILHTGSGQPISSANVTGDLGFKPRTGVMWKGKKAMTSNQLEVMRNEMRVNKIQKKASSQS
ncbi:hypothetical protein H5410_000433 [Solanum commersonii]|uniref:Uncharacterized protein n=1 Tax=Solanum commersonii TaxID=4109 RepID=A0A9J6AW84_SOLCO|nr:hypothetical protein H5410_000433 [Solanum commersonii]